MTSAGLNIHRMLQSESRAVVELWHRTKEDAYPYLPLEQVRTLDEDSEFFHQVLRRRKTSQTLNTIGVLSKMNGNPTVQLTEEDCVGRTANHWIGVMMRSVRLSVKAIIIREGRLLVLRCRDQSGVWYVLPGGGQMAGETLDQALKRECLEELGCEIRMGPLRFVRDYIAWHHEFAATNPKPIKLSSCLRHTSSLSRRSPRSRTPCSKVLPGWR